MSSNNDAWCGIEKLKGSENYHTWSFAVNNLLELNDYKACILTGDDAEKDKDKLRRAKARLALSIDQSIFVHIQSAKTAAEIWNTLKDLYEDKGLIRRIGLLRKLVTTRLETTDSMNDYVSQIMETASKLNGIGFQVPDE